MGLHEGMRKQVQPALSGCMSWHKEACLPDYFTYAACGPFAAKEGCHGHHLPLSAVTAEQQLLCPATATTPQCLSRAK